MAKPTVKNKRTTPEMSAEYRLKKWQDNTCPYCGGCVTSHKQVRKTQAGHIVGVHYQCLNDNCKAENFFSDKSNPLMRAE